MKFLLTVLSVCVLTTCASAQQEPLCDLLSYVTNDTWFSQAIMGVTRENYRPLECLAGCALYTINSTIGALIKSNVGPYFSFFDTCLKKGVQAHDTCKVTDCILDLASNGLKLAKSLDLKIPYLDVAQHMLDMLRNQPNVVLMDEQQSGLQQVPYQQADPAPQQPAPQLPAQTPVKQAPQQETRPATAKPAETVTPAAQVDHSVEGQTEKAKDSASSMIPTLGLLHVCALFFFLKNVY